MSLQLGRKFNRCYNIRVPFLDGFYNIGVFFDKRSSFLLFSATPDFMAIKEIKTSPKISMFKNLNSSKFCETFLKLHNYRKDNLDISNQFEDIKPEYSGDIIYSLNETLTLSKVELFDRDVFDSLRLYGFSIASNVNEFIFLIAERHNIIKRLKKKVVRTTGIQIATSAALKMLEEYHIESITAGKEGTQPRYVPKDTVIKLED